MAASNPQTGLSPNAWDSHMHIVDPDRYPLAPDAQYKPQTHTLSEAMEFESSVGIPNIVLVQPSIYGYDNSCLLEGLREIGPQHGRGIVTIDPQSIRPEKLLEWHRLGVRGVRLNLQSVDKQLTPEELAESVRQHARAIFHLNWVLQLYIPLSSVPALLSVVPDLGVRICLDHFSSPVLPSTDVDPASFDPYSLSGFSELVSLLRQGRTYVKISAPYRLSDDPELKFLGVIAKELLRVAPDRLVFATDWPHTRFEGLDVKPFIAKCLHWCGGNTELVDKLFRRNAEELWGL
ncbi:TIM barrel metal-dependent hydrolase [Coccidioides immitis RS]|uniref:TIM barrel metal-dependent hydrolase n=2 Tax=Coccidioides immitis TaxID=5501 RepID=J3KAL2_COCIM|nr:TIM barrel metal-dependent hydrolase [Coccidioides immitis RS]EAS32069.3 TIM barrel metal-dependent hydrolase [Coccidioides immitis RS]KMP07261.1 amidohydrolase 2 [Coccidioides immitis RMSCC 2394]TPX19251.1 hypothetical protein DIZ76_017039 [Coccidioides immitis]